MFHFEVSHADETRGQRSQGFQCGARAGMLFGIQCNAAVLVEDGDQALLKATLGDSHCRTPLTLGGKGIAVFAAPPIHCGDQVGREALGDLRVGCEQVGIVGVKAICAIARRVAH